MGTLDQRDRACLLDMVHLTAFNHGAAVFLLRTGLNTPTAKEEAAMFVVGQMGSFATADALRAEVQRRGDARRIETVLCARIFMEYIAACEDLGALGYAVRCRHQGKHPGIFPHYLASQTSDAAAFFDIVLALDIPHHPDITLETILNLPGPGVFTGLLTAAEAAEVAKSYRAQVEQLHDIATQYRHPGVQVAPLDAGSTAPPGWEGDVNILLSILASGTVSSQKGGMLVRAFNKLKHRFTLTERLPDYAGVAGTERLEYGRFPRDPDFIDRLVQNTVNTVGTTMEIAALVLQLDAAGLTF